MVITYIKFSGCVEHTAYKLNIHAIDQQATHLLKDEASIQAMIIEIVERIRSVCKEWCG